MKRTLFCCFALIITLGSFAQKDLLSPNGKYRFVFLQKNDRLTYSLTYAGKSVVEQGELGVDIDNSLVESAMGIPKDTNSVWTSGMELTKTDYLEKDTVWQPLYGEYNRIHDHYNELTLHFCKGKGGLVTDGFDKNKQYLFDIIVRAYDEGIAIRYHFPEATNGLFMHIIKDLTSFRFSPETLAFHETWAQGPFQKVKLLKADESWKKESERPLLLTLPNNLCVALAEAELHDFSRGKIALKQDNELQFSLFDSADIITAYDMPWRLIMVGEKPVDLINNKQIMLNLNEPCKLQDTSWIHPGKAFRVTQLNQKSALEGVDFAKERGLQYVELDAGWYGPEMKMESTALIVDPKRDLDIPALCKYAKSKGVGVWLYVNQRAISQHLDEILPLYESWGVSGVKFGFVQVGSQMWTTWLHDAVKKCAEHHIMVDIHDEYRPTGWSRTYPNLLTQEGIRGNEEMPDAEHNTTLPFTRFLCGPADYTLCYFNDRVKNTKCHQLAMSVVYYSPLTFMYWYDRPNAYQGEQELNFWKSCPTVWDESLALDGNPGEYIAQARRTGKDWYVGVMNGLTQRSIDLNTADFLEKGHHYTMELYQDDPTLKTRTKVSTTTMKFRGGKKLNLKLLASGGAAIRFVY